MLKAASAVVPVLVMLVLCGVGHGQVQDYDWVVVWEGQDRPGPVNLPFTVGWPVDDPGFEQHDPNGCYDPPGPDYAEAANVDVDGWLAIQNDMDGSCMGIGHVDGGACNDDVFLQTRTNPCGMRYQVGPRTVLNWWGDESPEIMAYHGPSTETVLGTGLTAEISFYIVSTPTQWTKLLEIEGYPRYENPWNTGGGDRADNNYASIMIKHFMDTPDGVPCTNCLGDPDCIAACEADPDCIECNEWHLVAKADNTFSLGKVDDLMGRWITVRLALGSFTLKPQMVVWVDGILHHGPGWDAQRAGDPHGSGTGHGYCRFGFATNENDTAGDVRIGTMAFTNQGAFSPNPRGQCRDIFGSKHLRHLPSIRKTRVNPEICGNEFDDDADGLTDCEDPDCYQDETCDNLLVNGSFEHPISPCEEVICPGTHDGRPAGWDSFGSGTVTTHGDQWLPETPATDGPTRGSVSSSGGSSTAFQTVHVVPGTEVSLKGDIATGHFDGMQFEHFIELVDGDETSSIVIDRFVETDRVTAFQPVSLSGICNTGVVTVRWGYVNTGGASAVTTHVDNLYLAGTSAGGPCNDPFADADGDGDVDQDDFAAWQLCFSGPGGGPVLGPCECFDVDGPGELPDGDVDQADYAWFETCASGPDVPADAGCDDDVAHSPIAIISAVSRRTHGTAGDFDLDILPGDAVETRYNGPRKLVITFDDFVQAVDGSFDIGDEVAVSVGTIADATLACDELTVDLLSDSVPDLSCLTITLHGIGLVSDPTAVMPDRQLQFVVLRSDATGDGVVDSDDVDDINASSGDPLDAVNFRKDVSVDGVIDGIDAMVAGLDDGHSASCP